MTVYPGWMGRRHMGSGRKPHLVMFDGRWIVSHRRRIGFAPSGDEFQRAWDFVAKLNKKIQIRLAMRSGT